MKKTVIASSLAVTLGLTGYALTNDRSAHASEQTTNYSHLADLAQNNPSELNAHPVQAGAYDISFVKTVSNITLLQMVTLGLGTILTLVVLTQLNQLLTTLSLIIKLQLNQ